MLMTVEVLCARSQDFFVSVIAWGIFIFSHACDSCSYRRTTASTHDIKRTSECCLKAGSHWLRSFRCSKTFFFFSCLLFIESGGRNDAFSPGNLPESHSAGFAHDAIFSHSAIPDILSNFTRSLDFTTLGVKQHEGWLGQSRLNYRCGRSRCVSRTEWSSWEA